MFNSPNPFKISVEERERQIEVLEEKFTEKVNPTYEEILQLKELRIKVKEDTRKKWIYDFFKLITDREMTEAEFKEYNEIMDNPKTRKGFNLKNFIEGDKGSIWIEKDVIINQESQ